MRLAREKGASTLAITNMMGTQITREVDSVLYTRCRHRDGRRRVEDVHGAGRRCSTSIALKLAQVRSTLPPTRSTFILDEVYGAARRRSPQFLDGDHPIEEIAQRHFDKPVLPLPRPPHRPAGRARGRAQAEGDLLHPDRGLLGRRDEARADRAARRGDAGRLRRDRLTRLRQGRLQHPGGAGARRARDRDRDRRQRGHPAPRRRRHLRAADAGVPAGRAGGRPAPAPRVPDRAACAA